MQSMKIDFGINIVAQLQSQYEDVWVASPLLRRHCQWLETQVSASPSFQNFLRLVICPAQHPPQLTFITWHNIVVRELISNRNSCTSSPSTLHVSLLCRFSFFFEKESWREKRILYPRKNSHTKKKKKRKNCNEYSRRWCSNHHFTSTATLFITTSRSTPRRNPNLSIAHQN